MGVKVTLSGPVLLGVALGFVNAKPPSTTSFVMGETADPPVSIEAERGCPLLIALAIGHVTVGVA